MTNLRFREDGSFRVLQMADIQDGPNVLPDTIRLIREAIRKADPDLVVFTGDQIRGYDPAYIDTFLRRRGEEPGARVRASRIIPYHGYSIFSTNNRRHYPCFKNRIFQIGRASCRERV